ncbi:MAG: DNA methyltransferase [Bacteroidetes bacterium]|nr:DNA methyltransferase [Bacteroidota bacterium]
MENLNNYMPLSNDWNEERLTKLKDLFPDLFTNEGNLNFEELKKVIDPQSLTETERFEFRWFGKSQSKRNAYTPTNATLIFDETRSVNPTESENIIIEGENLEVLKLLSNSYREKVKCIYIDPPYNTGKDFVYSDNYTEDKKPYWEQTGVTENGFRIDTNIESDGRFHSNWLDMIYSRLLIARTLLKPEGVIFISIDDNEIHHLRKLCDEVFGEENFIGCIARATGTTTAQGTNSMGKSFDYLLVYSKTSNFQVGGISLTDKDILRYNLEDDKGKFSILQLRRTGGEDRREDRPSMYFGIETPDGKKVFPTGPTGYESRWRVGPKKFQEMKEDDLIFFKVEDGKWTVYFKYYLEGRTKRPSNLWTDIEGNKKAQIEMKALFDEKVFDTPKPTDLIKKILQISTNGENEIILDFFAGSGTTGQAIFDYNIQEGSDHKFILIQLPEVINVNDEAYRVGFKKISDITIERNKRVVERIIKQKKEEQPNLFTNEHKEDAIKGFGFKVFKLVKSNFPRVEWAPDVDKTDEENIATLKQYIRDKEAQLVTVFNRDELMTEILLKRGFTLNYKTEKQEQFKNNEIFLATDGIKETLICLDISIDMETVEYFKKHIDKKFICIERALDTTKKYNLKHYMGDKFNAF